MLNLTFANVSRLKDWLKETMFDSMNPEDFYEWLQNFFDEGNTVTVHGEEYDYWACWELV